MESVQQIKSRLKGVKNINQITKAMELVAATKMRRSQEIALRSRPYASASLDLLSHLTNISEGKLPDLLQKREIKNRCIVLVTSDKGLAGAFNGAVIRDFEKFLEQNSQITFNAKFIGIGQKAITYLEKKFGIVDEKFTRIGDYTTVEEVSAISEKIIRGYIQKKWDQVIVFSTHFQNALRQIPLVQEIFPINIESIKKVIKEMSPKNTLERKEESVLAKAKLEYIIEPSPEEILGELGEHLILMQIYHLVLETNASEHAARRLAMKNASDNAKELGERLNLEYNKSRQAMITKEIIEISAGAASIN